MKASQQGLQSDKQERYRVVPRTLIFITSTNPQTERRDLLLIKGAAGKRLWANQYNGIGGHVEWHEEIHQAAQRELAEETGLTGIALSLCGVLNIAVEPASSAPTGVMVFLFQGESRERTVQGSSEGEPAWIPLDELDNYPLVDDLYHLIPLLMEDDAPVYGHYMPLANGTMQYTFQQTKA